jgi:hypothetical protein
MVAKLARRRSRVAVWDQASGGKYQSIPERPTPVVVVPDCQADTRKSGIFIFMTPMTSPPAHRRKQCPTIGPSAAKR